MMFPLRSIVRVSKPTGIIQRSILYKPFFITNNNVGQFNRLYSNSKKNANTSPRKVLRRNNNVNNIGNSLINQSYSPERQQVSTHLGSLIQPVIAVTTCESYDLIKIRNILDTLNIENEEVVYNEAVHFIFKETNDKANDIIVLNTGTIIAWGLTESDTLDKIVPLLNDAKLSPYEIQTEDMEFIDEENIDIDNISNNSNTTNTSSYFDKSNEMICLFGDSKQKLMDKIAFSYGLSRSTRLAVLEIALEKHIKMAKKDIEKLSKGIRLNVNDNEVLKSSGELLLLRGKLNLYSELIETPDLYWTEPNLEKIYEDISKALDINARISILNRKLDYASDEAHALIDIIGTRTSNRLEWIIIYLILIEVCFEIHHFYERLTEKKE